MAQVMSTPDFTRSLEPLTGKWVDMGMHRYGDEHLKIMKSRPLDSAYLEDAVTSSLGQLIRKPEGEPIRYDKFTQAGYYRYTPNLYALGAIVTHEQIRDGKGFDVAAKVLTDLGRACVDMRNTVCYNVLGRAFTSGYNGFDGKTLCATDHPTENGVTSNSLATPAALSEASVKQAFIEMKAVTDLRGNRKLMSPRKLIVPKETIFDAEVLLKTVGRVGTTDNDINPVKSLNLFPDGVVSSDWMTSTTNWFIGTDNDEDGLQYLEREGVTSGRDGDFDTFNARFKVYFSFAAGFTNYNCVFGVNY